MIRVLIVEDESYVAESIVALLERRGFEATAVATGEAALDQPPADVVLADLKLPGMSGVELLKRLKERDRSAPVLLLTGHGTIRDAVEAMRAGALDFLTKPVEPDVIVERLRKAVERRTIERERDRWRAGEELIARSPAMRRLLAEIESVAAQNVPVLLTGESGTGKELVATYIHEKSPRREGPLVRVHCGAVPAGLFEAEFFGHVRGAFTGATEDRTGWFAEADGGTLFLDEVGTLPADGQAKLLRALETGEVRPVGAEYTRKVDVRIVAATNENLARRRERGSFRSDLYYRLAGAPFELPPLRERPEDLEALASIFAAPRIVANGGMELMKRHRWPGNVRELRNIIARARLEGDDRELTASELEPLLPVASGDLHLKTRVKAFERELFREALRRADGRKAEAARELGIDPSNWAYHAKRLGLR
jgi:DNA-binding NtrC family response regulator